MTLPSLYRLERRGLLACPVVGVAFADWSDDRLREHAREAIAAAGETIDDAVFSRLAGRLSYVQGDFADDTTYRRLAERARRRAPAGLLPRDPARRCSRPWSPGWPAPA